MPWNPDTAPTQVMVRREGASIPADSIGLMDLKALYNDAATPVRRIELTGTPTSTHTLSLNAVPGNLRAFVVSAEAMSVPGKLILSGDLVVNHSLVVHNSGLSQPLILEYPAGTEILRVQPSKTMVVARGSTGYHYAMDSLVPLATKTTLTGTELLKIEDAGVEKKASVRSVVGRYIDDVAPAGIALLKFNNGNDITLAAAQASGTPQFRIGFDFNTLAMTLEVDIRLAAQPSASSNTHPALLVVQYASLSAELQAFLTNAGHGLSQYGLAFTKGGGSSHVGALPVNFYAITGQFVLSLGTPTDPDGTAAWNQLANSGEFRMVLSAAWGR